MAVTDGQIAVMHAYLRRDADEGQRLLNQLIEKNGLEGYGWLIWAAFILAVRRRFAPQWRGSDVIRYVATIRNRRAKGEEDIDPRVAEVMIRRALDDRVEGNFDDVTRGDAQLFVLGELIDDEVFDDVKLQEFLTEARTLADQLSSDQAR